MRMKLRQLRLNPSLARAALSCRQQHAAVPVLLLPYRNAAKHLDSASYILKTDMLVISFRNYIIERAVAFNIER